MEIEVYKDIFGMPGHVVLGAQLTNGDRVYSHPKMLGSEEELNNALPRLKKEFVELIKSGDYLKDQQDPGAIKLQFNTP